MIEQAAKLVREANKVSAFTGAGISVESGIPPFRGEGGLWDKYDPNALSINNFYAHPKQSWVVIKEIFYDFFGKAEPNDAHIGLAKLEKAGMLSTVVTQNIDNLHQEAGNTEVYEFHGNSKHLKCTQCDNRYFVLDINLDELPPFCKECGSLLKPDFVFFGEGIPEVAYEGALVAAQTSDLFIVIGTTGEVMPACMIPDIAKQCGANIIEINPQPSNFTHRITDVFIQDKAGHAMNQLLKALNIS